MGDLFPRLIPRQLHVNVKAVPAQTIKESRLRHGPSGGKNLRRFFGPFVATCSEVEEAEEEEQE